MYVPTICHFSQIPTYDVAFGTGNSAGVGSCRCRSPAPDAVRRRSVHPESNVLHNGSGGTDRRLSHQQINLQPVAKQVMSAVPYHQIQRPLCGDSVAGKPPPLGALPSSSSQANTHLLQVRHLPPALQAGGVQRQSLNFIGAISASDTFLFGADTPPRRSAESHYRARGREQS